MLCLIELFMVIIVSMLVLNMVVVLSLCECGRLFCLWVLCRCFLVGCLVFLLVDLFLDIMCIVVGVVGGCVRIVLCMVWIC